MRSLLFAPDLDPAKLEPGWTSGADVLVLDLTAGTDKSLRRSARAATADFLRSLRARGAGPRLFVQVGPCSGPDWQDDLEAVVGHAPDGIVLSACSGGLEVQQVASHLAAHEALAGLADGSTRIIAIAGSTAASILEMQSYRGASARLAGIVWSPESLARDLGLLSADDSAGELIPACSLARALTVLAARAAGVPAIDGACVGAQDRPDLAGEIRTAREQGFTAKAAIDPGQIPTINRGFDPR